MSEIQPNEIYTTNETQALLKVSSSTLKRLLKRGILRANKVGGQYRIFGKELLRILSPRIERNAVVKYQDPKNRVKKKIESW